MSCCYISLKSLDHLAHLSIFRSFSSSAVSEIGLASTIEKQSSQLTLWFLPATVAAAPGSLCKIPDRQTDRRWGGRLVLGPWFQKVQSILTRKKIKTNEIDPHGEDVLKIVSCHSEGIED